MKRLVLLLIIVLAGCTPWRNVEDDYDPYFSMILSTGATSPVEIGRWLNENIVYVSDDIHDQSEYWQSPDQTYVWRAGDCEDYSVLMLYMVRQEFGGWPELACGWYQKNWKHAWVAYESRWYEAQTGEDVTDNQDYELDYTVSYGVAMWRSMNTHRMLGEE